jgi:hypothetical protein
MLLSRVSIRHGLLPLFLAALLAAGGRAAVASTPANAKSPLGINLNGVSYYSTEQPFMNVFASNGGWLTQGRDYTWDTHEEQYLQLDANGYPKTLVAAPSDPHSPQLFNSVGVILDRVPAPFMYPGGRYVVLYDGEGTLNYAINARLVSSSRGRDVIDVTPTGNDGIQLQITATDPRHNGNYIRNIRIVSEQNLAAFEAGQIFDPAFLQLLARFRVLRFMDWLLTNDSTVSSWSDRAVPGYYSWGTNGVPLEVVVKLANAVSADPWLNVPTRANDDYIRQMAALVHSQLGPAQKVYVEYSNEVWNNSFPQYQYAVDRGRQAWPTRPENNSYDWNRNWYGMHSVHVCDIWKSTWGSDRGRVICVLGAQAGYTYSATEALDCPYWTTGAPCSRHGIDAIAIAPYFGDRDLPAEWAAQQDGGLALLFASLMPPDGSWFHHVAGDETSYATVAAHYRLPLIAYEGGQGFVGNSDAAIGLFVAANRDARMGPAYTEYLRQWKANGGELFVLFNDISGFGQSGEWGALESRMQLQQSAGKPPPKWAAIQDFITNTPCWWPQCSAGAGSVTSR